jgi:hypothetical protein
MNRLRKKSGKQLHSQQPQENKNLRINLTKDMKDLYNENGNSPKKEIKYIRRIVLRSRGK